jgi:hypothetical protein
LDFISGLYIFSSPNILGYFDFISFLFFLSLTFWSLFLLDKPFGGGFFAFSGSISSPSITHLFNFSSK